MELSTVRTWSSILGGLGVAFIINDYIETNEPHPDPAVAFVSGLIPIVMIGASLIIEFFIWKNKKK